MNNRPARRTRKPYMCKVYIRLDDDRTPVRVQFIQPRGDMMQWYAPADITFTKYIDRSTTHKLTLYVVMCKGEFVNAALLPPSELEPDQNLTSLEFELPARADHHDTHIHLARKYPELSVESITKAAVVKAKMERLDTVIAKMTAKLDNIKATYAQLESKYDNIINDCDNLEQPESLSGQEEVEYKKEYPAIKNNQEGKESD